MGAEPNSRLPVCTSYSRALIREPNPRNLNIVFAFGGLDDGVGGLHSHEARRLRRSKREDCELTLTLWCSMEPSMRVRYLVVGGTVVVDEGKIVRDVSGDGRYRGGSGKNTKKGRV